MIRHLRTSQKIFYLWLAWIFWLPLPLGSNRPWSLAISLCVLFLLGGWLAHAISVGKVKRVPNLSFIKVPLALWSIWLCYGLIQMFPMPFAWVEILSPVSAELWLHSGAQARITVNAWESMMQWFWSFGLFCVFIMTWLLVNSRKRVRHLVVVIVAAGVLQALFGSLMTLSGLEWSFLIKKISGDGVATGTFVNRNHFAGFVVLCLSLGLGRLVGMLKMQARPQREWAQYLRDMVAVALSPKIRLRFYLAIMVIGVVLSHSRMGNASFFIAMLLSSVVALFVFKPLPKPLLVLIISLVVIDISILGAWFGVDRVVERIQQTGVVNQKTGLYTDQARLDVDEYSLIALSDFGLTGSGGGSYQSIFPLYRQHDVYQHYDHAHNDYLEFALEYGVVALCVLPALLLLSLWQAIKAQRNRKNRTMRGLGFGVGMAIFAVLMHSFVDFNLHIPAYSFYFVIILSLGWVSASGCRKDGVIR